MTIRYVSIAAALALAAFLVWHPARPPALESATPAPVASQTAGDEFPLHSRRRFHSSSRASGEDVVYVAGAVKRPGLYHLPADARNADAIALAGGMSASADAGAVNLAARASDGDEIYVPQAGEAHRARSEERHSRRHSMRVPPEGSVDVNGSSADELARVPGIGRAIAQRIVELRQREGGFTALDQLLDVAGMSQTRLDRALPYLRQP